MAKCRCEGEQIVGQEGIAFCVIGEGHSQGDLFAGCCVDQEQGIIRLTGHNGGKIERSLKSKVCRTVIRKPLAGLADASGPARDDLSGDLRGSLWVCGQIHVRFIVHQIVARKGNIEEMLALRWVDNGRYGIDRRVGLGA